MEYQGPKPWWLAEERSMRPKLDGRESGVVPRLSSKHNVSL